MAHSLCPGLGPFWSVPQSSFGRPDAHEEQRKQRSAKPQDTERGRIAIPSWRPLASEDESCADGITPSARPVPDDTIRLLRWHLSKLPDFFAGGLCLPPARRSGQLRGYAITPFQRTAVTCVTRHCSGTELRHAPGPWQPCPGLRSCIRLGCAPNPRDSRRFLESLHLCRRFPQSCGAA